jgi:hypothetical protein
MRQEKQYPGRVARHTFVTERSSNIPTLFMSMSSIDILPGH